MADKKPSATTDKKEKSPAERTKTVLVPRVNNVLEAIRVMANCANPNAYQITAAYNSKIFGEIDKALAAAKKKFADAAEGKTTTAVKTGFDL